MTTFDQREHAFEEKFARDEELRFRVHARRNRLLGLWAAQHLGMKGPDAEKYAEALANADVAKFHDDELVAQIAADFKAKGVAVGKDEIHRQMAKDLIAAKRHHAGGN